MGQHDLARLMGALQQTSQRSPLPQLNDSDVMELTLLLGQMAQRYAHQDLADSMEGYQLDYETLALRYSLPVVRDALAAWRTKPGALFFPQPSEIATEIERQRDKGRAEREYRATIQRKAEYEAHFWAWVDERLKDDDTQGMSEQQFLDTVTAIGWTGKRARDGSK